MRKKRISTVVGAAVLAGVLSVSAMAAGEADVIGTWYLNVMEMEGTQMNPAMLGMEMTLEVAEDGTVLTKVTGEEDAAGRWEMEDGVFVFTDDTDTVLSFTCADDTMTADMDGVIMTFGKEKAEYEAFDPGEIVADPKLEDFEGSWEATLVDASGMQMPVSAVEMGIRLELADGKATMYFSDGTEEAETEEAMAVSVEDGMLKLVNPESAEAIGDFDVDLSELSLRLHENDVLSYFEAYAFAEGDEEAAEGEETGVTIYFERR